MRTIEKKEQIILLNYIGEIYRKELRDKPLWELEISEEGGEYRYGGFQKDMNDILFKMQEKQAEIIKNDFLLKKDKNWWKERYSKSSYYRLKNIAMNEFFRCVYE